MTVIQVGRVQADNQPNLFSLLGDTFASSARQLTKVVGNILNIENKVTQKLCELRTVRIDLKTKFIYLN